jgi:hypothetical protein
MMAGRGLTHLAIRLSLDKRHGVARLADVKAKGVKTVPSRFVLEFDWRGFRLDEDTWSGSKVNRLIGEFLGQAMPSVHFAHRDLT